MRDWPRAARVVERVAESARVASFWLDDPLAPLRPPPKAEQHLRVYLLDGEGRAAWRCYTMPAEAEEADPEFTAWLDALAAPVMVPRAITAE